MKRLPLSILIVLALSAIAAALTFAFLMSLRADTSVVVAARPIQVGARLSQDDLKVVQLRSADALPGALKKVEEAVDQVVSVQRMPGDQVTKDMLGSQAISSIAASLPPDHRAVAIKVSRSGGLAGILRPGDSVMVIGVIDPANASIYGSPSTYGAPTPTAGPAVSLGPDGPPVVTTSTPTASAITPSSPFARITASGLKVLLVPQSFRYQEVTKTDSSGFAAAQSSQVGQNEGVIVLDVPATPITINEGDNSLTISLPELIALLDAKATVYLALEPVAAQTVSGPGVAIEQLVNLGVGGN